MNAKIRRQLADRKRRIEKRLDKTKFPRECPVLSASNIHYEVADRTQAIAAGGIGAMHQLVKRLGLDQAINRSLNLFKIYLPYSESDHVLNIAYALLPSATPGSRDNRSRVRAMPSRCRYLLIGVTSL